MMKLNYKLGVTSAFAVCLLVLTTVGCGMHSGSYDRSGPAPLGTLTDPIWQNQELNAEMSDFVIYQHEFEEDAEWLTLTGEDHVKQIAARVMAGQDAPVVVERSMTTPRADTKHGYPIHPDPDLDRNRREIIVRSLLAMGVPDADERVLVAPAFAEGFTGDEAEAAYVGGIQGQNRSFGNAGGFGGFMFSGGY